MSEVQSKVVEIIVDKLGVKESEVTPKRASPTTWEPIHSTPLS